MFKGSAMSEEVDCISTLQQKAICCNNNYKSRNIVHNVKQIDRPLEEDDDSDATYCSAVEEYNIILNTSPEDNNSNMFQSQSDMMTQYHHNVNEEKLKIQPSTYTGIRKKLPITSQGISPHMFSSRSKSEDAKHIQQRLADIREEVHDWFTGWGKEPQRSQLEQLVAELQHLHTAINTSSFPYLKAHVLQEMKQVAEKLQYQLNSVLNEIVNDFGNTCCNCGYSCGSYNEYAGNATTEPSSHKLGISSRDPRLHSIAYCSLMSNKIQTCQYNAPAEDIPWNSPSVSKAERNIPSQNVYRPSIKQPASIDTISYSADMFEIDCKRNNEQKNNYLTQDSTKPSSTCGGNKSITSAEPVSVHTKDSNSNGFALQNQKLNLTVPILSRNKEQLQLDCVRNQFQKCSLTNTKGSVYNNIVIEEMNNDNQLSKLNSQDGSGMVNLSDTTRTQLPLCEIKESAVSIEQFEYNESSMRASLPAEDLKHQSLGSEIKQPEVTDNSSPPHSKHRNQNVVMECEKCGITLTHNSKDPLSVDIFASCTTACHIQNDKDAYNVLPTDETQSELCTAASPVRKISPEQHWKCETTIPSVRLQRKESVTLNTGQTLPQLAVKTPFSDLFTNVPSQSIENVVSCVYSKGNSKIIPSSKNKRLHKDSVSQSNQISQQSAKKNSANNITKATKTKAKRIAGKAKDTEQSVSLSLDMFASDTQTFTFSENKSNCVNERSLKCSKMALKQLHENHTLNISKQVELKQGSLAHCIKRIRLPCPSEYSKNSDFISNFWNNSPYPLPQEFKISVESW